ncbi:ribonucleoside-triphosphate reductase [Ignicoccus pacificus DSM 13166]|uniref:Ribonucleoside-triphosphate reductase n=1 Tax=Ignicoccus pacificus DSM 13166 TaxID=940294 RepID=A0A977KAY8_9CREN|nr:ribonucleoside-triphosphate reductase [Ignicoccus pacificus DSM 13166]
MSVPKRRTEHLTQIGFTTVKNAKNPLEDMMGRSVNSNEYQGPNKLLLEAAERYFWEHVVEEVMPKDMMSAHREGVVYVHKLPQSVFLPYCNGNDYSRVLKKGLRTPTIVAGPARRYQVAMAHAANFLAMMQQYWTGAQAYGSLELWVAPFIAKEHLSDDDIKQGIQTLYYELNLPWRPGMQTPFTNITVTYTESKYILDQPAIIGGASTGDLLGDFLDEARRWLIQLGKVLQRGDALRQPFTFPIPTLMPTAKDFYNDPELFDAIFGTAAKMGSYYWLNSKVIDPDSAFAMCCRYVVKKDDVNKALRGGLRLKSLEEQRKEELERLAKGRLGGTWAIPDITGSIGVVTVNLPRVALDARGDVETFFQILEERTELVAKWLSWWRAHYLRLMRSYKDFYSMVWEYSPEWTKTHFNTIGAIGMPEAAAILMDDPEVWTSEDIGAKEKAVELMDKMIKRMADVASRLTVEWGEPFNVEEVPGETAAAKLFMNDLRHYPEVRKFVPEGVDMYSTSVVPYYDHGITLWQRIRWEGRVQQRFTGGVMMHIFLGEQPDPEALARLTQKIMDAGVVYWSYTPALSVCENGHKTVGLYTRCPRCGAKTEIWSRIIGYYRPVSNWNPFRQKEFRMRTHYESNLSTGQLAIYSLEDGKPISKK